MRTEKVISFNSNFRKLLLLLAFCLPIFCAQTFANLKVDIPISRDSVLENKLFYFLTILKSDEKLNKGIKKSKILKRISFAQLNRTTKSLKDCRNGKCYAKAIRWTDKEITDAGTELINLLEKTERKQSIIEKLKKSGCYAIYHELADTAFIRKVWQSNAYGINRIFHVYLGGNAPKRYAAIDSISYRQDDPVFIEKVSTALTTVATKSKGKQVSFYDFPLKASLAILNVNGRDEAARYEPLTEGYNAIASKEAKITDWTLYKYSVLLVPGYGPEKEGVKLHEKGIERCKLAAERFKKGLAPFIIVSGGHVYPFRTSFSEAIEMKKYLIEELGIPAGAIIIEPHARHTTTNIRNASRLLYRLGIPSAKPGLVVTDAAQTNMIKTLDVRCIRELGYVPYKDVRVLNDNEVEFNPSTQVFQINIEDVLDP